MTHNSKRCSSFVRPKPMVTVFCMLHLSIIDGASKVRKKFFWRSEDTDWLVMLQAPNQVRVDEQPVIGLQGDDLRLQGVVHRSRRLATRQQKSL
jgi:hypothetical protein